jgi:hypothetical protein
MVGLLIAVESVIACDILDFTDPVSLSWRMAAQAARDQASRCVVLCAGDSLVKHAVIPKVIAARSGRATVNLAIARGPAPATYFLLRRAIESGAHPVALVVDFKPSILTGGPRHCLRYWQEILSFRETLELAWAVRSGSFFFELSLGRLLPSVRSRYEIRSSVWTALRGEANRLQSINRTCRRNWLLNDGANIAAKNPAFHGEIGPDGATKYLANVRDCHPVNAEYIRRLFKLAASRNIAVYWLLPPLYPQLQARREQTGADLDFVRFVRSVQARSANVTVVDARHAQYNHTLFVDATHLDGEGAYTLSRDLADVLQNDLAQGRKAASRWVELPDYRAYPVEVVLEDVEQSRRAVTQRR